VSNVRQTIILTVSLTVLFVTLFTSGAVQAASTNVKDCIENEDCLETDEAPANETENEQKKSTDDVSTGSLFFNLVKMGFALLLVLGLIYGLLKFLRKRNKLFQPVKALENLGGISVGPNKSVQLVRIGSKIFVVGVGENVELLKEITDEAIKNELLHHDNSLDGQSMSLLSSLFQQKTGQEDKNKSANEFTKLFSTELEKLKQTRRSMINQQKQREDKHE